MLFRSRHLSQLFLALAAVRPAGRAGLDNLFRDVGPRLSSRSIVAVVGDFMEEPQGWTSALSALVKNHADLRAFHVYDPAELELRYESPLRLRSPETDAELPVDPGAARDAFTEVVAEYFAEVRAAVHARRGRHYPVPAGADLTPLLARFLLGAA